MRQPGVDLNTRLGDMLNQGTLRSWNRSSYPGLQVWNNLMSLVRSLSGYGALQELNDAWAQTMSQITSNPTSEKQGTGFAYNIFNKKLFDQLQITLPIQMGRNGPQQSEGARVA